MLFVEESNVLNKDETDIIEEMIWPFKFQLTIAEDDFNKDKKTLFATYIWNGARALCNYLLKDNNRIKIENKSIVEFGKFTRLLLPSLI